jgi:polar amino acid transport system substrate-binding protein
MPSLVRTALAALLAWLLTAPGARADVPVITPGTLTICSAVNRPPMAFFSHGQPEGVDVALGTLLAAKLGLQPNFVNIPFAGLIPALLAGHCDVIMAQLFIKPARLKVIDEIPYMVSHLDYLLLAGAPKLNGPQDLSGKKVAAVNGTTSVDVLTQANAALAAAGRKLIRIVVFPESTQALQQLEFHQVDAFAVAYETGLFYSALEPSQFELGAAPCCEIKTGIGIAKSNQALETAIATALRGLMQDGGYAAVFAKWHLQMDMLAE